MFGETSQKTSSGLFPLSYAGTTWRYLLFFLIGSLAMVLHARLRMHLGIPGHQGLLYMALMMGFCLRFPVRFGCLAFGVGSAAILLPGFLGFSNPFISVEYILAGLVADLLLQAGRGKRVFFPWVLLAAALGYGMIPVFRLILTSLTGYPYGSFLKHGFLLTLTGHLIFASLGAGLGFGVNRITRRKTDTHDQSSVH